MLVSGVNDKTNAGQTLIGNASCTTNSLAPVAKVLHDSLGIRRGLMNTMRAATATQKTADGHSHKDWRGGRGILGNIVPCVANAATAVGVVIPDLNEDKVAATNSRDQPCSIVFDADASIALDRSAAMILVSYDNEWGYSHRCLEMVRVMAG